MGNQQRRLLLERDPTKRPYVPSEKNPERPVSTRDRVDEIRKFYRKETMRIERASRETVESWLPELFQLAVGTGWRITRIGPFCLLVWPLLLVGVIFRRVDRRYE